MTINEEQKLLLEIRAEMRKLRRKFREVYYGESKKDDPVH